MTAEPAVLRRDPVAGRLPMGLPESVLLRGSGPRTLVEFRLATASDGSGADTGAAEAVLGFELPTSGRSAAGASGVAVWLGPGWWLLDLPLDAGAAEALEAPVAGQLRGAGRSAVDVSAGFAVLELVGPAAPAVLAHGCSIDLHPRVFGPGRSARTMLAKAQVVLAQLDSAPTYRIWVRTSFARYLVDWLTDAAAEYVGAGTPH